MVNNDFRIIGYATSNIIEGEMTNGFQNYSITIEIEGANGNTNEIELSVMPKSKNIDYNAHVVGHIVVVAGYLSTYKTKFGNVNAKLIATSLMVLDKNKDVKKVAKVDTQKRDAGVVVDVTDIENLW